MQEMVAMIVRFCMMVVFAIDDDRMLYSELIGQSGSVIGGFSTVDDGPPCVDGKAYRSAYDKMRVRDHVVDQLTGNSMSAYMDQSHTSLIAYTSTVGMTMHSCDALWTDVIGLPLVVQVADCVPVFLYDPVRRLVAVVHAGWRGAVGDIVQKTLQTLVDAESVMSDVLVRVGPSICQQCYPFGDEASELFSDAYVKRYNEYDSNRNQANSGGCFVDVKGMVIDQLLVGGVVREHLDVSRLCTFEESSLLYSYRGEGKSGRRMYGVLMMS